MSTNKSPRIPSYRLHKSTGLAVVRLNGKDFYLGKYGTSESKFEYDKLIAEWIANHRQLHKDRFSRAAADFTVNELFLAFWDHAEMHYRKNGRATSQLSIIKLAAQSLTKIYGKTTAMNFRPSCLRTIRETMIELDLSRSTINKLISVIKQMFKWGVENELVPSEIYNGLQSVSGLRKGRGEKC